MADLRSILIVLIVIAMSYFAIPVYAISPPDTVPQESGFTVPCYPEICIQMSPLPMNICLNGMSPEGDSCVTVSIDGSRIFGAIFHFSRSADGKWSYSGMNIFDSIGKPSEIHVEVSQDSGGNLKRVHIIPGRRGDSLQLSARIRIVNDRPADTATDSDIGIIISQTVFDCRQNKPRLVIEERKYTYPPGYRRDPVLNYPELSMFHYGISVRMPTARSLEHRAQLYLYWHCRVLAELEYDDPEEMERKEAAVNRLKDKKEKPPAKKKKKPLISFRPLR